MSRRRLASSPAYRETDFVGAIQYAVMRNRNDKAVRIIGDATLERGVFRLGLGTVTLHPDDHERFTNEIAKRAWWDTGEGFSGPAPTARPRFLWLRRAWYHVASFFKRRF